MKGRIAIVFLLLLLVTVLLSTTVSGARVFGTIYDSNLNTVSSVVVEANSTPIQRHVSKYGGYSFDLQPGSYEITATLTLNGTSNLIAQEFVEVISQEGDYIVDLFIFKEVNLDTGFKTDSSFDWQTYALFISIFVAILAIIMLSVMWFRNKSSTQLVSTQTSEVDSQDVQYSIDYTSTAAVETESVVENNSPSYPDPLSEEDSKLKKRILQLITDNSGEMTQKEIRKKIDLSEAKISQVLTELTTEKKIKKIKKGRSNVIVLI